MGYRFYNPAAYRRSYAPRVVTLDNDQQAKVDILRDATAKLAPRDREFAGSLVSNFYRYGHLSEKQMEWVKTLTHRAVAPKTDLPTVSVTAKAIFEMFARASKHLKYPKVVLQDTTGAKVVFGRAGGASRYAGQVMVSDGGPFGNNKFYGRISEDGVFTMAPKNTQEVLDLVKEFAANPEVVAARYGRLTGNCCFCHRPLKDERSTSVGYGPVCADRFGLKWGA